MFCFFVIKVIEAAVLTFFDTYVDIQSAAFLISSHVITESLI